MLKAKLQKPKKVQKRKSNKFIKSSSVFLPDESARAAPDYPRLLKALGNASPGQLIFLQINSQFKRKQLPKLLETDGLNRHYAIADFSVLPKDIPPYQVLREFLKDCGPCEILYVDGLEHIVESSPKIGGALEALAMGREILANLGVAVVFLLPLYLINLIRNHALNLWIWRAHDYNLDPLETAGPSSMTAPSFESSAIAQNDTPESRERRIRILRRLLEEGKAENRSAESLVSSVIYPLANDLYEAGHYNETRALLSKALKNNTNTSLSIALLDSLARVLLAQGEYNEAEKILKQLVQIVKTSNISGHLGIYQKCLNNLATAYHVLGRIAEAKSLYAQALEIGKKMFGEEHPAIAANIFNLASIYALEKRYAEAEPLHLQALRMRKKLFGQEHPVVASSIENLAELYGAQGRFAEAEKLHWQALEMRRKFLGRRHPVVAESLYNLAVTYYHNNDFEKAEPLMAEAYKLCKNLLGENHSYTINVSKALQLLKKTKKKIVKK